MAKLTRRYETDRTRRFRAGALDAHELRTIEQIEEFGCSVMHVAGGTRDDRPLFSYTVGATDTAGGPELLCIGLKENAVHFLLNEAVDRLREGVDLSVGRHRDLIGEVECEFRPVAEKWIEHLMGWATWYNEGTTFSVLQAIYPDHDNRFPGEEGFNKYFSQPLLQPDAIETRLEQDFWAANDPNSSLFDWKFPDQPHTMVFLSETANSGAEPITYVSHDEEDGAWQFLGKSMDAGGGPVLSCFHHPVDKDPSLKELADLPLGWCAEREKPGEPWVRRQQEPEDSSEDESEEESS